MKALLIGGTGATGPPIANEILERGFELAIYHRGVHEVPLPPEIEHIHGDPHFIESIERDLADRRFDLVVATYGRIRHLARFLRGRTDRFISIGGFPVMKGWMAWFESIADRQVDQGGFSDGREISRSGTRELPWDGECITGYNIIEAESLEEAEQLAEGNPFIHSIRIYEVRSK